MSSGLDAVHLTHRLDEALRYAVDHHRQQRAMSSQRVVVTADVC